MEAAPCEYNNSIDVDFWSQTRTNLQSRDIHVPTKPRFLNRYRHKINAVPAQVEGSTFIKQYEMSRSSVQDAIFMPPRSPSFAIRKMKRSTSG